jgi:hypothetical protein
VIRNPATLVSKRLEGTRQSSLAEHIAVVFLGGRIHATCDLLDCAAGTDAHLVRTRLPGLARYLTES